MGLLASCSPTKFLNEGEYLLDKVEIKCADPSVNKSALSAYVHQQPNAKWFNVAKVPLGIYSLSSSQKKSWLNRTVQKIGEKPVVFDRTKAERSCAELEQALQNMGYLSAQVTMTETELRRKISLTYHLTPGNIYRINTLKRDIADTCVARCLEESATESLLRERMVMNINTLDKERERIVEELKNRGYYKFSKDYISFTADTVQGSTLVDLTMHLDLFRQDKQSLPEPHPLYRIKNVHVLTEFDMSNIGGNRLETLDRIDYNGLDIHYRNSLIMRPKVLADHNFMQEGELYRAQDVNDTYASFGKLNALKYTNIHFVENPDSNLLNAFILTAPARAQSFTVELDGTNTAGDMGFAASVSYQHKNLFKGSETFTLKARGAYEAISGLQGYSTDNYTEYGVEASLSFPRFVFPFLSNEFKRRIRASSEVGVQYNTQERPEFSRRVMAASWSYKWAPKSHIQHRLDLLDVNYVYMPSISATFRDEYLNSKASNSILKYNYEDLFIARLGYSFSYSSQGATTAMGEESRRNNFSIRTNIESSGLLLNLISRTLYDRRTADGQYAIGNIAYAQYIKGDIDFTQRLVIDRRNSLVFHAGFGIAYPYGNSTILPFEKRYFSGGANSVRGWSVRSLGPGSFSGGDKNIDFINQTGDIKLDFNMEYRVSMFKMLSGAVFIDAGNIWTLREYEEQPGGAFRFDSFLSEIAVAYGLGFRLNLGFFILRLDGGMKAINPAFSVDSREHYPLLHPDFGRDFTFHFAVGYPF